MILALTQKGDGKELLVNTDHIKFVEMDSDGTSAHIVFGESFVRVVNEGIALIQAATGAVKPFIVPLE